MNSKNEKKIAADVFKDLTKKEYGEAVKYIFDSSPGGVMLEKSDGTVIYANQKMCEYFGYLSEEFIGKNVKDLLPEEAKSEADAHIKRILSGEELFHETINIKKDGTRIFMEIREKIFHDDIIIVIANDVSSRVISEQDFKREKLLSLLADNVPDLIWAKDLEGKYIFANKSHCDVLLNARDTDEPIGKTDIFFAMRERKSHPDDPEWHTFGEICFDSDKIVIESGKPGRFDEFGNVKGHFLYLDVYKKPLVNDAGQLVGTIGSARVVTKEKMIESENNNLLLEMGKLSTAVKNSSAIVVITDSAGNIEYVNPKFIKVTGYTELEVIGKNPRILNAKVLPEEIYGNLWKTITYGDVWEGELINRKKSGEIYWEQCTITPVKNSEGEIVNFVAIKEDITEAKNKEIELTKAKEKAEDMNRMKSSFLANMSHELRTPMNGILGFSFMIKTESNDSEIREMGEIIYNSGKRLMDTLNMILDLSKIESGSIKYNFEIFNINESIEQTVKIFSPKAANKDLKFNVSYSVDETFCNLDKRIFSEILFKILSNAIKYTYNGSISIISDKIFENGAEKAVIKISDTGIGIAKENLKMIFEEFRQESEGFGRKFEGTGLGLSLAKKYIEQMNGYIDVESQYGVGSEFKIVFPAVKPEAIPIEVEKNVLVNKVSTNESDKFKTILALDDDLTSLKLIKSAIGFAYDLTLTSTAAEAIKLAEENNYDLFIMDINLGRGISGLDVVKSIRKLKKYYTTPIVAVTAFAMKGDKDEFLSSGCTHYISKPFELHDFRQLIKLLL